MNTLVARIKTDGQIAPATDTSREETQIRRALAGTIARIPAKTKADIFKDYANTSRQREQRAYDVNLFITTANSMNGFDDFPPMTTGINNIATAELAVKPINELQTIMNHQIELDDRRFARDVIGALEENVRQKRFGVIDHFGDFETARYCYFLRNKNVTEELRNRSVYKTEETTLSAHAHDIINTRFTAAREARVPKRVKWLLDQTPGWILDCLTVVTGDQISEAKASIKTSKTTFSHTLPAPKPVYRFDPALCLGTVVITGWNDAER